MILLWFYFSGLLNYGIDGSEIIEQEDNLQNSASQFANILTHL